MTEQTKTESEFIQSSYERRRDLLNAHLDEAAQVAMDVAAKGSDFANALYQLGTFLDSIASDIRIVSATLAEGATPDGEDRDLLQLIELAQKIARKQTERDQCAQAVGAFYPRV